MLMIKRLAPDDSVIYSDEWKAYDGLVNDGYKKHYRVKHCDDVFANGKAHVNDIENFRGISKMRLTKFRGLRPHKFYLHLKETEFRFNHRHENLYQLLLDLFDNRRNKNGQSGASFRQNRVFYIRRGTCCPDNAVEVYFYCNVNSLSAL
ncbi:hypothetical protein FACS1894139_19060 [Planctomycetales bacterium]|nr:hypothetical protein FACS1894107_04690 [Planctomycetales bacterium]GHS98881.1 hypothetical protein FACS1894108_07820 [Planctomycetales bacterium]GHT08969.1 hypothetical protein FACS1894139_19060 [Planctomycetales bacterium]